MAASRPYVVRRPEELRALASPVRQELVEAMGALQPCTVARLGEHLGRLPVSLYYHLRKLEDVGLVVEAGRRPTERGDEALYRLRNRCIRLDPDRGRLVNRTALQKIGASILRHAIRLNDTAVGERLARSPLERRHSLLQRTLRLGPAGLERVNAKIAELTDLLDEVEAEAGDEFFTVTLHLAPNPGRIAAGDE